MILDRPSALLSQASRVGEAAAAGKDVSNAQLTSRTRSTHTRKRCADVQRTAPGKRAMHSFNQGLHTPLGWAAACCCGLGGGRVCEGGDGIG